MTPLASRRLYAGAALSALLSTIIGLLAVTGPASAGSNPTPKPGKILADSGFRPATNGYGFQNYGAEEGVVDMNARSMRRLFGTRVCSRIQGPRCTLTPAAEEWMNDQNSSMAGGHCFGMATTSQFFFQGFGNPSQPDPFGSPFISELEFAGNTKLQRHIATAWATQSLKNVRKTFSGGDPRSVIRILSRSLDRGESPWVLLMFDDSDGHAITPYAVNRLGENQWQILVYDNNYPGAKRALNLNTKRQTWRYQIQPGKVWGGDAKTGTLALAKPRVALGQDNPCPFCKDDAQADDDASNDGVSGDVELRLASPASGTASSLADFRVTREGSRGAAGLGPDGSYDTLKGAEVYQPATGVMFTDPRESTTYPQLTLDADGRYDVDVTQPAAQGARGGAPVGGPESLTMTGAGYSLSATFAEGNGAPANASFDAGQRSVTFVDSDNSPVSVELGATVNTADADYDIDVSAGDLPDGTTLVLSVDPATDAIQLSAENVSETPVSVNVETKALEAEGPVISNQDVELDGDGTAETVGY